MPIKLPVRDIDKTNTAVGTTLEDIGDSGNTDPEVILGGGYSRVSIQLTNTGANALVNFELHAKTHKDASFQVILTGAGWGTIAGRLLNFDGALNTLAAAAAAATALINVEGFYHIKFQADADTGGSGVTIKGMAVE